MTEASTAGIIKHPVIPYLSATATINPRGDMMMSELMKAVRLHAFGRPDVLVYEDAPKPTLAPGEVLVRVHAAGLNPPDLMLRDGYRALPPEWRPDPVFPLVIGTDVSGIVEDVADDVTGFVPGAAVFSMVRFPADLMKGSGAYAEFVAVPASQLARKPAGLNHVQAAGAPMSLLTAWQFLIEVGHDAPNAFQSYPHQPVPLAGKTIVVNGAGGGVGHLLVQIAKWQGANVVAVASGRNEALMRELGADQFIDYTRHLANDVMRDADLVVDAVGGVNMERFLHVLKPGGALFLVNPLGFAGHEQARARGITVSSTQVRSNGLQLAQAGRVLEEGTVRIVLDSSYPLADAWRAHERAMQGGVQGKIVLMVR